MMDSNDKDDGEESVMLSVRILFAALKFNIFTFMLIIFSSHIIYIPILREYAKLGFNYGNTILLMAIILHLITLSVSMLGSRLKNSHSWNNAKKRRKN
jgi:hypothetical protein